MLEVLQDDHSSNVGVIWDMGGLYSQTPLALLKFVALILARCDNLIIL